MPDTSFLNKTALVTGSSGEIGKGIALKLAAAGADIVLCCRTNINLGERAQLRILEMGRNVALLQADLGKPAEAEKMVQEALHLFGHIDILVNNAGATGFMGPITETSPEDWDQLIRTNLYSAFYTSRLIVPSMINRKSGRVINISSIGYRRILPDMASYLVSKAGLNTFTQALSREVAQYGITVNAIAPGQVSTERVMKHRLPGLSKQLGKSTDEIQADMLKESHTKQFSTVDDVAELVLFLASDKAKNITGEIIDLAGGF